MAIAPVLYCTLEQARIQAKAQSTNDDKLLKHFIEQVSKRVDIEMHNSGKPMFVPVTELKSLPLASNRLEGNGTVYKPWFPIQSVAACTVAGDSILADVEVDDGYTLHWISAGQGFLNLVHEHGVTARIRITGVWCFHHNYANAFTQVDTLAVEIGTTTATTLTVDDADGEDELGVTPRFSYGQIIRIGSELMLVTKITGNVLTVQRGINGTTADTHLINVPVEVFQIETPVAHMVARQVAAIYERRGAFNTTTFDGASTTQYPADLLEEMKNTLLIYRKHLYAQDKPHELP